METFRNEILGRCGPQGLSRCTQGSVWTELAERFSAPQVLCRQGFCMERTWPRMMQRGCRRISGYHGEVPSVDPSNCQGSEVWRGVGGTLPESTFSVFGTRYLLKSCVVRPRRNPHKTPLRASHVPPQLPRGVWRWNNCQQPCARPEFLSLGQAEFLFFPQCLLPKTLARLAGAWWPNGGPHALAHCTQPCMGPRGCVGTFSGAIQL